MVAVDIELDNKGITREGYYKDETPETRHRSGAKGGYEVEAGFEVATVTDTKTGAVVKKTGEISATE